MSFPPAPPPEATPPGQRAAGPWLGSPPPGNALTAVVVVASVLMALAYIVDSLLAGPAFRALEEASTRPVDSTLLTLYDFSSLPAGLLMLVAWAVTCAWLAQGRSYSVGRSPDRPHARGRAWVWLGWFVPVVSFWFPFQVVRDIYRNAARTTTGPARLGWWWAAWLTMVATTQVHDRLVIRMLDEGRYDAGAAQTSGLLAALATVVALVLWLDVVRSLARAFELPSPWEQERLVRTEPQNP